MERGPPVWPKGSPSSPRAWLFSAVTLPDTWLVPGDRRLNCAAASGLLFSGKGYSQSRRGCLPVGPPWEEHLLVWERWETECDSILPKNATEIMRQRMLTWAWSLSHQHGEASAPLSSEVSCLCLCLALQSWCSWARCGGTPGPLAICQHSESFIHSLVHPLKKNSFIFDCAKSLLLHDGFLELRYADFSLQWLLLLQSTGSAVVTHGLICSTACGIFLEQGSNQCLLQLAGAFFFLNHWKPSSTHLKKKKINNLFGCPGSSLQHAGSFSWGMQELVLRPGIEAQAPWIGSVES